MQSAVNRSASVPTLTLDQCPKHSRLQIIDVATHSRFGANDSQVTQRLKELGFLPGAQMTVIGFGLLGRDPVAVQINGTKFALRRAEAAKILVAPVASISVSPTVTPTAG